MIYVTLDDLIKQKEKGQGIISLGRWVQDREVSKLFRRMEVLSQVDFQNGISEPWCSISDCCGCADCGQHDHEIVLDENTRLKFGWNTWRGYQNGLQIEAYNHEKDYWETIYECYNSLDVTSWKYFWLNEFDRKYLLHINLRAILQLKEWKARTHPEQTRLGDYL